MLSLSRSEMESYHGTRRNPIGQHDTEARAVLLITQQRAAFDRLNLLRAEDGQLIRSSACAFELHSPGLGVGRPGFVRQAQSAAGAAERGQIGIVCDAHIAFGADFHDLLVAIEWNMQVGSLVVAAGCDSERQRAAIQSCANDARMRTEGGCIVERCIRRGVG